MSQLSYSDKLKDVRWQQVRLRIFDRDKFTCTQCGSKSETISVHHGYYAFKTDPWDYPAETLHTVCETCHKLFEEVKAALYREIGQLSIQDMQELFRIVTTPENDVPFDPETAKETIMRWINATQPNHHQLRTYLNEKFASSSMDFKSEFYKHAKGGKRGLN